jgi:hypothetical protein
MFAIILVFVAFARVGELVSIDRFEIPAPFISLVFVNPVDHWAGLLFTDYEVLPGWGYWLLGNGCRADSVIALENQPAFGC